MSSPTAKTLAPAAPKLAHNATVLWWRRGDLPVLDEYALLFDPCFHAFEDPGGTGFVNWPRQDVQDAGRADTRRRTAADIDEVMLGRSTLT